MSFVCCRRRGDGGGGEEVARRVYRMSFRTERLIQCHSERSAVRNLRSRAKRAARCGGARFLAGLGMTKDRERTSMPRRTLHAPTPNRAQHAPTPNRALHAPTPNRTRYTPTPNRTLHPLCHSERQSVSFRAQRRTGFADFVKDAESSVLPTLDSSSLHSSE